MSIESNFFGALFKTQDWKTVVEKQITSRYFEGNKKRAFNWIRDFEFEYGQLPSLSEFQSKFPQVELTNSEDPMAYHCDELREKVKHNLIADATENVKNFINNYQTEEAYKELKKAVLKVETEVAINLSFSINKDIQKRYDRYVERRDAGGLLGIPTEIQPLDYMLGGIKPNDLITFYGFTGTGKTWMLIILAVTMAKLGYKVLFLTREMSPESIGDRIDAVWCGISYSKFRKGTLSVKEEKQYVEYLNQMEKEESNLVVEMANGVLHCASLIDTYKPDICFVDGGYLMTEDNSDDDWKGMIKIWRAFKNIAMEKKVPVVTTTQLKSQKASLDNAAFAKAIANECDAVFGMEQSDIDNANRVVKIVPLKLRDSEMSKPFKMNWDFNEMNWSLLFMEEKYSQSQLKMGNGELQKIED